MFFGIDPRITGSSKVHNFPARLLPLDSRQFKFRDCTVSVYTVLSSLRGQLSGSSW